MRVRLWPVAGLAFLAEILAILTLVIIVAIFGPSDPDEARIYAERVGYWVGPIAGFLFTLAGGWWIGTRTAEAAVLNGLALGVAVALIDITILVASGSEFQPIFAISNLGRVAAGTLGGWIAASSHPAPE